MAKICFFALLLLVHHVVISCRAHGSGSLTSYESVLLAHSNSNSNHDRVQSSSSNYSILKVRGGNNARSNARSIVNKATIDIDVVAQNSSPSPSPEHNEHHKMSLLGLIINIVADLCPHGMLPLAYGFAKGGPSGLVPSLAMVLMFGLSSGYTMSMYARMAEYNKVNSISGLWEKLINPKTRYLVDLALLALTTGCCIFYSAFIGDIFEAIIKSVFNSDSIYMKRSPVLLFITGTIVLPLCLIEDMSALKYSSIFGVAGILYTVFFHAKRLIDGTYAPGGPMLKYILEKDRPRWANTEGRLPLWTLNSGTLVLANMLCLAFLAHYNAINYFKELTDATIPRFNKALAVGYGISLSVFTCMMLVGYLLFGNAVQPLILNNFPKVEDIWATGARLATGAAIVFAYPLMFAALKSALKSLLSPESSISESESSRSASAPSEKKGRSSSPSTPSTLKADNSNKTVTVDNSKAKLTAISVAMLAAITGVAMKCGEEDVSLVLGIIGSVLGCSMAYILPGSLALVDMRNRRKAGLKNQLSDVLYCHLLVLLGAVFGILGVWITLSDNHHH